MPVVVIGCWLVFIASRQVALFPPQRAAWTRNWAVVGLLLGRAASAVWWQTILPNG